MKKNKRPAGVFYVLPISTLILLILLFSFGGYVSAQSTHPNILMGGPGYDNEPSIALDPENPMHMVAGANLSNIYYSDDGGWTWTNEDLTSSFGVWGDPVILSGLDGRFFYFHLSNPPGGAWIDRIVCQWTDSIAGPWSDGSYMGLNGNKAQDKEWGVVDRRNGNIYVSWTQFDDYGSSSASDSSVILFSRSLDNGLSWSSPVRLSQEAGDCLDDDNTTEGAVPAVGPNGEVYVAWTGPADIRFDRSLDNGQTWLNDDILVADHVGGWAQSVPGILRCNGMPITLCDTGNSVHSGNIYICWNDERSGPGDLDVWITRSTDQGNTWSNPVRVNQDGPGNYQFFPWMAVDQVTGYLWAVFYDRRNHTGIETDVYMALSKDGGQTWIDFKVSETPFTPNSAVFFGDYTNIVAYDNIVRPIWCRMDNGDNSIYTAIVNTAVVGVEDAAAPLAETQVWPNPVSEYAFFSFKLRNASMVQLELIDARGKVVAVLRDNEFMKSGKYVDRYPMQALQSGIYNFVLRTENGVQSRKVVK